MHMCRRSWLAFLLHVLAQLSDGGRHAQGPHDDGELVQAGDLPPVTGEQLETVPELCKHRAYRTVRSATGNSEWLKA